MIVRCVRIKKTETASGTIQNEDLTAVNSD